MYDLLILVFYSWMLSFDISEIAIITIKIVNYCCIIHNISNSETIDLLKNSVLEDVGYI